MVHFQNPVIIWVAGESFHAVHQHLFLETRSYHMQIVFLHRDVLLSDARSRSEVILPSGPESCLRPV